MDRYLFLAAKAIGIREGDELSVPSRYIGMDGTKQSRGKICH